MSGSEQTPSAADVQSPDWEGHIWSAWHTLENAIEPRNAKAPNAPGLYRIRCANQDGLIYIGETGDSLRGRFRQLKKAMEYAERGKYAEQGKNRRSAPRRRWLRLESQTGRSFD
jgi:hypothetical protein